VRALHALQHMGFIMNKTNLNARDDRDTTNAFVFATNELMTQHNVSTITLKQIIATHKIKCDSKLIRRVLRKYYAQKINHQHRDAWVFATSQINDVIKLIDTHCRAGKSS
jgi:hypothetical protein